MSRRLGDDPLTRARAERAKAAEASAVVALDSAGQQGTAQVSTSSRKSYNDVFFQRRGEGIAPEQQAAEMPAHEAPEISEISEFPEIRDAATSSGSQAAFEVTASPEAPSAIAQGPPASIIEEVVAKLNVAGAKETAAEAKSEQVALPPTSQAPRDGKADPKEGGGFLKRFFRKLK